MEPTHQSIGIDFGGTSIKFGVVEGKEIIANSGLNVIPADDLDDAAQKIVKAVKG